VTARHPTPSVAGVGGCRAKILTRKYGSCDCIATCSRPVSIASRSGLLLTKFVLRMRTRSSFPMTILAPPFDSATLIYVRGYFENRWAFASILAIFYCVFTQTAMFGRPVKILTSPLDSATPVLNRKNNLAIKRRFQLFFTVQIKISYFHFRSI